MNWQHLRTILWLRWRMSLNQLKRGGIASTIILALLGVCILGASVSMFLVALLVGIFTLPNASPEIVMYLWDVIVLVFLMSWMIGLLTELQRSEVLSLQKLLHLPVSLSGTFLINYLGSLASLTLVILLPGMIGLSIALVTAKGPAMLAVFPLLAGFLLMVTALTYQFQGWLASLMANPRRRRTIPWRQASDGDQPRGGREPEPDNGRVGAVRQNPAPARGRQLEDPLGNPGASHSPRLAAVSRMSGALYRGEVMTEHAVRPKCLPL